MKDIYIVGSLNMDISVQVKKTPDLGETVEGTNLMHSPGGKGANQAVAAARMGGQTHMYGCVGNDADGDELIRNLEKSGVDIRFIKKINDANTGIALIWIANGDNSIVISAGANRELKQSEAEEFLDGNEGDILCVQLETPIEIVEYVLKLARKKKMITVVNPAPAKKLSSDFLQHTDIMILNESETATITGIAPNSAGNMLLALEWLRHKGVNTIILTLGDKGGAVLSGQSYFRFEAKKVTAVDTTAAGDTFIGAFCAALSESRPIKEAVEFAAKAASISVTRKGAQNSIPEKHEVLSGNKF